MLAIWSVVREDMLKVYGISDLVELLLVPEFTYIVFSSIEDPLYLPSGTGIDDIMTEDLNYNYNVLRSSVVEC